MSDTIDRAIEIYGHEQQLIVALEELAELQKEITKKLRGKPSNMAEEIADVEIMLEQLKRIDNVDRREVEEVKKRKLIRLEVNLDRG